MKATHVMTIIATVTMIGSFAALTTAEEKPGLNIKAKTEKKAAATRRIEATSSVSEEELIAWLEQFYPEGLEQLRKSKEETFPMHDTTKATFTELMMELEALRESRPELFRQYLEAFIESEQLERKSSQIACKIAQTEDENTQRQLTMELKSILATGFEVDLEGRAMEIQRLRLEKQKLESKLQNMKNTLEKRKQLKHKIVERRLKVLLHERDNVLDW